MKNMLSRRTLLIVLALALPIAAWAGGGSVILLANRGELRHRRYFQLQRHRRHLLEREQHHVYREGERRGTPRLHRLPHHSVN